MGAHPLVPFLAQLQMKHQRPRGETRHCEKRSDEAIRYGAAELDCFAQVYPAAPFVQQGAELIYAAAYSLHMACEALR